MTAAHALATPPARSLAGEVRALRTAAVVGVGDHLACVRVRGAGAHDLLDRVSPRELFVRSGQLLHTVLLDDAALPIADVYIGCDAHSPKYWPESFKRYINSFGQDKVLFGTDFPILDFERTREEIEALGLKPEAKRKLLRDNALRIYKLAK